jgi:tRNA (adenine37-N6)-methyltransferase
MDKTSELVLVRVGNVDKSDDHKSIMIDPEYRKALTGLSDFGHVIVVWWADKVEDYRFDVGMEIDLPYAPGTQAGLFATRSPVRPNPVCMSTCAIEAIDVSEGTIVVDEIDAMNGTPVLDVKPYYGTLDRVEDYKQPAWVPADWPLWRAPEPEEDYGLGG